MPTGTLVNSLSILTGGLTGMLLKKFFPDRLKQSLLLYFGFGAIAIGIFAVIKLNSLPVVILSIITGGLTGELLNIDGRVKNLLSKILNLFNKKIDLNKGESNLNKQSYDLPIEKDNENTEKDYKKAENKSLDKKEILAILIAIFCFSGTGIMGVLAEGMTGDSSVLLAKSVLDFFTALIFATTAGIAVSLLAVPQIIVFLSLFFAAKFFGSYLTAQSIANLIATGGIITLMIGFNVAKIKEIKVLNCIPAFIIAILLSQLFL